MARPTLNRTCSSPGCTEKHKAYGYCLNHYRHKLRHNTLDVYAPPPPPEDIEDYWQFVKKELGIK